ncbi:hypothetical protein BJ508DRAFT_101472 [Ascobolus immersus RN42]|uniref:Uncharacterized protein n=1 Tax=Ascobolus immersus RN42 TaxID=1160509 RepID=A0A3N4HGX7_ASCIM|nr:hypothetical protein BJ508DRAFT_101472 [Ascobolus immersus RN42]
MSVKDVGRGGDMPEEAPTISLSIKGDIPIATATSSFIALTANPTGPSDPLLTQALKDTNSSLPTPDNNKSDSHLSRSTIAIVASVVTFIVLMILVSILITLKRRKRKARYLLTHHENGSTSSMARVDKVPKTEKTKSRPSRGGYFSVSTMYSEKKKSRHMKVVESELPPPMPASLAQRAVTPVKAPFELPGDTTWVKGKFLTSTIWDGYSRVQNAVPAVAGTPVLVDTSYKGTRRTLFPGEEEKARLDELFESGPVVERKREMEERKDRKVEAGSSRAAEVLPSRNSTTATFGPGRNGKTPLSLTNIDEARGKGLEEYPAGEAERYEVHPLRNSEQLLYGGRKTPRLNTTDLPSRTPTNSTFGPPTTKLAFTAFSPTDFEPITKDQTEYPAGEAKRFQIPSRRNSNGSVSDASGGENGASRGLLNAVSPMEPQRDSFFSSNGLGVTIEGATEPFPPTANPLLPSSRSPAPELSMKLPAFVPLSQTPLLQQKDITSPTFETHQAFSTPRIPSPHQTYTTPRIPAPLQTAVPPQLPQQAPFTPINPSQMHHTTPWAPVKSLKAESFLDPASPDSPASSMALPQLGDEPRSSWGSLEVGYVKALERRKLLQELAEAELQVDRLKKELKEKRREEQVAKGVAKSRKRSEKELREREAMIVKNRQRLIELADTSSGESTEREGASSDTDRERTETEGSSDISRAGSTTRLLPAGPAGEEKGVRRNSTLKNYSGGEAGPSGRGIFDPRGIWARDEVVDVGYGEECNTV